MRGRWRRGPAAIVTALAVTATAVACADTSDPASSPRSTPSATLTPLAAEDVGSGSGRFVSTEVSGRDLVDGTEVELTLDPDTMTVTAGCNTMFGAAEIADGVLRWSDEPASTMMMCSDELVGQDDWLRDLLVTGATATTDGVTLVLESDEATLTFEQAPEADLEALLGRTWTVVGTISDGTTSRLPERTQRPRLVVGQDGLARLQTGCNTGRTRVRVDSTGIEFSTPTVTRVACPEPDRTVERTVLAVIDGRPDEVHFDGSVLVLVRPGAGLVLQVR